MDKNTHHHSAIHRFEYTFTHLSPDIGFRPDCTARLHFRAQSMPLHSIHVHALFNAIEICCTRFQQLAVSMILSICNLHICATLTIVSCTVETARLNAECTVAAADFSYFQDSFLERRLGTFGPEWCFQPTTLHTNSAHRDHHTSTSSFHQPSTS